MNMSYSDAPSAQTVMVTDVDQRAGLYAAQTLGRLGFTIIGGYTRRPSRSRFIHRHIHCENEALSGIVGELHRESPLAFILPVSINACWSLQQAKRQGADLPLMLGVDAETLSRINDKLTVCEAARSCGVQAPRTIAVDGPEALAVAMADFAMPAVAKLRNDIGTSLAPVQRYRILRTPSDVRAAAGFLPDGQPLLVQSYIDGAGAGVGLLLDNDGGIRARVAYRRLREFPLSGGPSTVAVTIDDEPLLRAAVDLVRALDVRNGIAHVEFRLGANGPVVMEINPRLWGTVRLGEYAGQCFVERWVAMAQGRDVGASLDYSVGIKVRSLPHDLKGALSAMAQGRLGHVLNVFGGLFNPAIKPLTFAWDDIPGSLGLMG